MQLQVGLSAHSVSQLQAPPPPAFSSQYQPAGQMPPPHRLQVPSSQFGPGGVDAAVLLSADAESPGSALASSADLLEESASPPDLGSLPATVAPPH